MLSNSVPGSVAHSFSAFPKDGRSWEVIMYGELQPSLMGQGINVLLAQADWRRMPGTPETRQLCRPLGDVAGLPIGSCWIDGASAAAGDRRGTSVIEVPALYGSPTNKLGETSRKKGDRPVYPLTGLGEAPTWRIRTGELTYFVPAVELIRAVFGSTTDFLRLTIEGGTGILPTKRRMIFDIDASGRDPSDPGVVRIKAHRKLHRREAETIARILTNDRMRKAFVQVFKAHQKAVRDRKPKYPTTLFPFDEPTRWKVDTEWTCVTSEGASVEQSRRRLITRIRSIETSPLTFRKVVVELTGGAGEMELGEMRRPVALKSSDTIAERIRMHPHRTPVSNLNTTALNGGQTSHEPGFELEHVVMDASGRQSVVVIEDEDNERVEMGSTWWPSGKKGGAVGVSFQSSVVDYNDHPRQAGALLESSRKALEFYAGRKNWPCEVVSPHFGPGSDPLDGLFRYPPQACGRPLRWSIMRNGELRRALVMRLTTHQGEIYAIDAERQGTTEGQAMGLVLTSARDELDYEDIEDILATNAANRGVWDVRTRGYLTAKSKRNALWFINVTAYSAGLAKAISGLLSGAPSTIQTD